MRFYTLDTSRDFSDHDQDLTWAALVEAVSKNAQSFILESKDKALLKGLAQFGTLDGRVVSGSISAEFIERIAKLGLRRLIEHMEFFQGDQRTLEHFDNGDQFSVELSDEEFDDARSKLRILGVHPGIVI
jgi:hypothetical protein